MTQLLNSWKEIATYLGRGVRTAQRWERDLRLPVRRPRGKDRSAVIAFTDELDRWLKSSRHNSRIVNPRLSEFLEGSRQLHENTKVLEQNMILLQQNIVRMVRLNRARASRSAD